MRRYPNQASIRGYYSQSLFRIILLAVIFILKMNCDNAYCQTSTDTIPKFTMVSIDGKATEVKPNLNERINGAKDLIIIYPSDSSILEDIMCTSLHDYFTNIGMPVSYHYAPYDREEINGNMKIIRGNCAITDIDFVKNSNTLVMIPDYNWGYSGYRNRLDIHLNVYDIVGGFHWKVILDDLSIDPIKNKMNKKIIKKLQKQVTDSYAYNDNFSINPVRMIFSWKEKDLRKYCDENPDNFIDGIYEVNDEKLGVHIDDAGYCNILYFSGSELQGWREGQLRGLLEPTSTPYLFKGSISDQYYRSRPATIFFENGLMSISLDNEKITSHLKMYPQYTAQKPSVVKKWSGTGFALNNGYIVTNNHVVEDSDSVIVRGVKGDINQAYPATIIGVDKNNDLALIKISDSAFSGFGEIPYAITSTMSEVGEDVYVLGYPMISTMGNEIKLTNGIINSKTGFQGDVSLYQISAPIQPGNSGGPLFNKQGNIIGVISAKHSDAENVGYAIKSLYLRNLIESCASPSIIPCKNSISTLPLTEKIKVENKFVFLIECSSKK